jgi:hypothetical protein
MPASHTGWSGLAVLRSDDTLSPTPAHADLRRDLAHRRQSRSDGELAPCARPGALGGDPAMATMATMATMALDDRDRHPEILSDIAAVGAAAKATSIRAR